MTFFLHVFFQNKLTAFSQKDDVAYIPNIVRYRDTIRTKVVHFFNSTMKKSLADTESYIVDIFVGTTKVNILYQSRFQIISVFIFYIRYTQLTSTPSIPVLAPVCSRGNKTRKYFSTAPLSFVTFPLHSRTVLPGFNLIGSKCAATCCRRKSGKVNKQRNVCYCKRPAVVSYKQL